MADETPNGGQDTGGTSDAPTIPEGYLSQEQVNLTVQQRLARDRQARLNDAEYRTQALEAWKNDPDFLDTVKGLVAPPKKDEADTDKLLERLRKTELEPVTQKLSQAEQRVQKLLAHQRDNTILSAVAPVAAEGADEALQALVEKRLAYDEEYDGWFVKGADGEFEYTSTPEKGKPAYKTAAELIGEMRTSGKYASLFKAGMRSGGDFKNAANVGPQDIDAQIREAESSGDTARAKQLKGERLRQLAAK